MAFNVYLTLFRKKNAQQLKNLEWKYHVMCYGTSFAVAFVYIFINTDDRGSIYGPATLWCWVDINWVYLRIAFCYAPAWCCILLSFCIYVLAGREIFIKRQQLRAFNRALPSEVPVENPFTDFKTTEIRITSELATINASDSAKAFMSPDRRIERAGISRSKSDSAYNPYTVVIGSTPMTPRETTKHLTGEKVSITSKPLKLDPAPSTKPTSYQRNNRAALEANAAAWGYTKVALLFFISLLVTWVSPKHLLIIDF